MSAWRWHGPHQVAQKSSSTTLPSKSAFETVSPPSEVSANAGIGVRSDAVSAGRPQAPSAKSATTAREAKEPDPKAEARPRRADRTGFVMLRTIHKKKSRGLTARLSGYESVSEAGRRSARKR